MFELSRVLAPVVFSDNCRGALRFAAGLATRSGAALTILHVLEPLAAMGFDTSVGLEQIDKCRHDWVRRAFEDFTFGLKPHVTAESACVAGDPATEIVKYAEESGANLLVLATHGHGPFRRFLLGSVTAKVLHDAGCPVCTGAHLERVLAPEVDAANLRSVLCAVDFGAQTEAALEWSAGIASMYGAPVSLLHVVAHSHDSGRMHAACEEARQRLQQIRQTSGTSGEDHVAAGPVAEEVANFARRLGTDLLVIGRGHLKGGGRLRSTAYAILRESPCPVVSV
jgi:nucleotide-binding universal stress UspA family protein